VTHHVVVDLEHAGELVEGLRARREAQEVVDPLLLLVDRIGELAPAPHVVAFQRPAALLDQGAQPCHDIGLLGLGQLGVQQQQNLVLGHAFPFSFLRSESAPPGVCGARERRRAAWQEAGEG
jgi:hypothetical protein